MFYNDAKCHHLHIGSRDLGVNYVIPTHQGLTTLEKVTNEKDLGVTIHCKLNFRDHIVQKVNLANRNLGIIFRTFTYIDSVIFLNLYKSLVRPHLEYATQIWSPLYKKDNITIENVQRRATRLVKSVKHLPYPKRLKKIGLPTLEYRRQSAGPSCSKLTMSLVNETLKFQTLISQICQYFLLKKREKLLHCKSCSHFFKKKYQWIWL